MKKHPLILVALLTCAFGVSTSVAVFAEQSSDGGGSDHAAAQGHDASEQDPVVTKDKDTYGHLKLEDRFGVTFHEHAKVCTDTPAGEMHCDARVVLDPQKSPSASAQPRGYGPAQFLKAYNLSQAAGSLPIIAIVDAYDDPNIARDLATYSSTFNIPQLPTCTGPIAASATPCFQKVNQQGKTSSYPAVNAGWALEISLDVEAAHAVCQNCSILLVEANSSTYANLMTSVDKAVALGATVVSNSYGSNEFAGETSYDTHFNHPGVVFTFSSGDSGYGAEYPAASQYVTAVGGTTLLLNPDSSYNQELAWSGAGSGCSSYEAKPSWQTDAQCSHRTVADVSADADPNTGAAVYDTVRYGGKSGWFQVGGTSLSSPLIAAVYALSGNIPSALPENSLPYLLSSPLTLNDVTGGSNGSCNGSYLCTAVPTYDGPTGLGSPHGTGAF